MPPPQPSFSGPSPSPALSFAGPSNPANPSETVTSTSGTTPAASSANHQNGPNGAGGPSHFPNNYSNANGGGGGFSGQPVPYSQYQSQPSASASSSLSSTQQGGLPSQAQQFQHHQQNHQPGYMNRNTSGYRGQHQHQHQQHQQFSPHQHHQHPQHQPDQYHQHPQHLTPQSHQPSSQLQSQPPPFNPAQHQHQNQNQFQNRYPDPAYQGYNGWGINGAASANGGGYYPSMNQGYPQMSMGMGMGMGMGVPGPGPATMQNGYGYGGGGGEYGRQPYGGGGVGGYGNGNGMYTGPGGGGYDARGGTEGDQQLGDVGPGQGQGVYTNSAGPGAGAGAGEYPYSPQQQQPIPGSNGVQHSASGYQPQPPLHQQQQQQQHYFPPNHPYAFGGGTGFTNNHNNASYTPYPGPGSVPSGNAQPGPPIPIPPQGYGGYGFGEGFIPPPQPPSSSNSSSKGLNPTAQGFNFVPQVQPPPPSAVSPLPVSAPPPAIAQQSGQPTQSGQSDQSQQQPQQQPHRTGPAPIPVFASIRRSSIPNDTPSLPPAAATSTETAKSNTDVSPTPASGSAAAASSTAGAAHKQPNGTGGAKFNPPVMVDGEKLKGIGGKVEEVEDYEYSDPPIPPSAQSMVPPTAVSITSIQALAGMDTLDLSRASQSQPQAQAETDLSSSATSSTTTSIAPSSITVIDSGSTPAMSTSATTPTSPLSASSLKTPRAGDSDLPLAQASSASPTKSGSESGSSASASADGIGTGTGTWQFVGPSMSGYMSPPNSARQPSFAQAMSQAQAQGQSQAQAQSTGSQSSQQSHQTATPTSTSTSTSVPASTSNIPPSVPARIPSTGGTGGAASGSGKKTRPKMDSPIRFASKRGESSQAGENAYALRLRAGVPSQTKAEVVDEPEGKDGKGAKRVVREKLSAQRRRAVYTSVSGEDGERARRKEGGGGIGGGLVSVRFGDLEVGEQPVEPKEEKVQPQPTKTTAKSELDSSSERGSMPAATPATSGSAPASAPSSAPSTETAAPAAPTATAPAPPPQPKPKPTSWAALVGAKPSTSTPSIASIASTSITPTPTASAGPSKLSSPTRSIPSLPPPIDGPSESSPAAPSAPRPAFNYAAAAAVGAALSPADELVKLLSEGLGNRPVAPRQGTIPRGLINTGNMCFANTILQTLAYCPPFTDLLETLGQRLKADLSRKTPLLEAMIIFLREFQPGVNGNGLMGNSSGTSTPTRLGAGTGAGEGSGLGVVNGALPVRGMARSQTGPASFSRGAVGGGVSGTGGSGRDAFVPENVYDAMKENKRFDSMRRGFQEDAEEYLGFFLNTLHEELLHLLSRTHTRSASDSRAVQPNGHNYTDNANSAREHSIERPLSPSAQQDANSGGGSGWLEVGKKQRTHVVRSNETRESAITRIFGGTLRSILHTPGSKDSITLEPYQPLQLDITDHRIKSIGDALRQLSMPETVQTWSSSRKENVDATKTVYVETWPMVLMCHLKRFVYDAEEREVVKKGRAVAYGTELVVPNEIISPTKRSSVPVKYRLFGVVYHHGSTAGGGHYTVAVARQDHQQWIHFDDELVSPVPTDQVVVSPEEVEAGRAGLISGREKCAYLLFYQRVRV